MKAAIVYGKGDLRLEDIAVPPVPSGSIRVRVQACAICGTDLRIYRKGDYRAQYPVVVGHEIAGIVDAVAPGSKVCGKGTVCALLPATDAAAAACAGRAIRTSAPAPFPSLGYKVNGGFEELFAVPENIFRLGFVNPIPPRLSFAQASLSEIIACCINAQHNAQVRKGDTVLVLAAARQESSIRSSAGRRCQGDADAEKPAAPGARRQPFPRGSRNRLLGRGPGKSGPGRDGAERAPTSRSSVRHRLKRRRRRSVSPRPGGGSISSAGSRRGRTS